MVFLWFSYGFPVVWDNPFKRLRRGRISPSLLRFGQKEGAQRAVAVHHEPQETCRVKNERSED